MIQLPDANKLWSELSEAEQEEKLRWLHTHPRDEKERRDIRRMIAAEIAPLLIPEGFVKCCTTFLRRYGADLLQCLSINYRGSVGLPAISLTIFPLYEVTFPHWDIAFVGIRTNPGIEGDSLETVCGIRVDPFENSYLGFRENFDEAIAIEKELLAERILPLLNGMKTTEDYFQYLYKGREVKGIGAISIFLYKSEYAKARELTLQRIAYEQEAMEKRACERKVTVEEMKQLVPVWARIQEKCESIVQAIDGEDTEYIEKLMNESQLSAYAALQKYTKAFAKKYPFQKIVLT